MLFQVAAAIMATGGADTLYGAGNSDDVLQGLAGDDTLSGDTGSDTYVYDAGDGNDTIIEVGGAGYTDRLTLGSGISLADVTVRVPRPISRMRFFNSRRWLDPAEGPIRRNGRVGHRARRLRRRQRAHRG